MTETVSTITSEKDSRRAGLELGEAICEKFNGSAADAIIVFASAQHDYDELLEALAAKTGTTTIVGSSSAGEFTDSARGQGYVSAMAIRSFDMQFAVGVGRQVSVDAAAAAREVASSFKGTAAHAMPYRSALVMADALAGHTEALVQELTLATGGSYRFFGGGAGDDGLFRKTHIFARKEAISGAAVALEILSNKPLGVGVSHGWLPSSVGCRVTEADGARLVSLNGAPAIEAFDDYAQLTGQTIDHSNALPFFLHNILGIQTPNGYRLRVPLGVNEDGSVLCAAAIPEGAIVHIMKTTEESAVVAAQQATRAALDSLGGQKVSGALVFDCVATRLRLGRAFDNELRACAELLKPASFVGCNTYGQIARSEGQFGGFHNCTAVVCVFPE